MRVTLVTTWDIPCGIAEHAFYLKEAIEQADRDIEITVEPNLHPHAITSAGEPPDWVWLNYHAALHSQWTPEHVRAMQVRGSKVGITYHDTGVPNSAQCTALHAVADAFVIHEPAEDLPGAIYLRQGIPDWGRGPWQHDPTTFGRRPIVGSIGFPFPWKNYDLLAEASALAGWGLLLIAPNATHEQAARWSTLNPHSEIRMTFTHRMTALALLSGCDATAFLYANANTGTSAAIRLGIAARKPVIATSPSGCRQFRDLWDDASAARAISWLPALSVESVADALGRVRAGAFDSHVVRLAHQDRWSLKGAQYAAILRGEVLP